MAIDTDDDTVGRQEVADRGGLAGELGVVGDAHRRVDGADLGGDATAVPGSSVERMTIDAGQASIGRDAQHCGTHDGAVPLLGRIERAHADHHEVDLR